MKDDWATPQLIFDKLNAEFHFTLDVCAIQRMRSALFLLLRWIGSIVWLVQCECVVNPPYGKKLGSGSRRLMDTAKMVVLSSL